MSVGLSLHDRNNDGPECSLLCHVPEKALIHKSEIILKLRIIVLNLDN